MKATLDPRRKNHRRLGHKAVELRVEGLAQHRLQTLFATVPICTVWYGKHVEAIAQWRLRFVFQAFDWWHLFKNRSRLHCKHAKSFSYLYMYTNIRVCIYIYREREVCLWLYAVLCVLSFLDLKRTCGMMDMVCMHASTHVPWCIYLSIYLSLHPFIHLPIYLFIYPSIHVYPAFTCSLQMYELLFV